MTEATRPRATAARAGTRRTLPTFARISTRRTYATLALAGAIAACARAPALVSRPADTDRSLVIRNVRVFDAPRAVLVDEARDVVVRDGRIVEIGPSGLAADGLRELDGGGGTLLPGLVDAHTHTGSSANPPGRVALPDLDANLAAFLYAGVTTVLDLGGLSPAVFRERADVASGARLGPHVYAAGPCFTAPGGHPVEVFDQWLPWYLHWYVVPRAARQVATPAEARAAVAALLPERPDILKLMIDAGTGKVPVLDHDTIAAITEAGHAAGIRSIAHVGSSDEALAALRGGVDALAHSPWRDELSTEVVKLIVVRDIPVVATLAVWDLVGRDRASLADYLPIEREVGSPELLSALLARPNAPAAPGDDLRRAAAAGYEARRRNVAKLHDANVTILAGSDAANPGDLPGAGLHLELAKLVGAGLEAREALRAATSSPARFIAGDSADFGEIAVGKRADLVLVAGNPALHIEDLGRITAVILDGVVLDRRPAGLQRALLTEKADLQQRATGGR